MEVEIRALAPGLLDDYLYFFDHAAFNGHAEREGSSVHRELAHDWGVRRYL